VGISISLSGPEQDEDKSHGESEFPGNEWAVVASELHNDSEPGVNAAAGSLPTALSRHAIDHCHRTRSVLRFNNIDGSAATLLAPVPAAGTSSSRSSQHQDLEAVDLPRFTRNMGSSSSEDARHSRQSTDQYPVRINYRFASASLEASLLQRMEARQRLQVRDGFLRFHSILAIKLIIPKLCKDLVL